MSQHPHADHRPPTGQDSEHMGSPPVSLGQIYPTHDIVAVLADKAAAEQALEALQGAGIPEGDLDLMDPQWFLDAQKHQREGRNVVERIEALVAAQEGSYMAEYEEEAKEGRWLIAVHAEEPETVERARDVLKAHGGRRLRHYKPHTVEEL
jgi:hypothetical protein